ncbi:MAG: hypothetical protein ACRDUY_15480 [Nitriliruptorales bacterium]
MSTTTIVAWYALSSGVPGPPPAAMTAMPSRTPPSANACPATFARHHQRRPVRTATPAIASARPHSDSTIVVGG